MKDLQPQDALVRYAGQTVEVSRSPTMHRRARFSVAIAAVFALISAGCGSRADEQAVDPVPETAESPALVARQTGEPSSASVAGEETVITEDTTDTDTDTDIDIDADIDAYTTTTTSTPVTPVPPLVADVALIGSIRTVPDGSTTEENLRSTGATDAVIASLACTRSTGCEPTDLATWAANEVDVLNLATSRAALDGATLLSDYADVLLASGVATVGFGANLTEALTPVILGSGERPIAVYAISLAVDLPESLVATATSPGVAGGPAALTQLTGQIGESLDDGQAVIVITDFDRLDDRSPQPLAIEQIETLVDAGANGVVGHGSDFLQRFERIDQTAVAFGLGNAATNSGEPLRRDTAVLRFSLTPGGTTACLLPATGGPEGIQIDDPTVSTCQ